MNYMEAHPTSRDDLASHFLTVVNTLFTALFSLIASPPGSGKTELMYHTANAWYSNHKKALVYLCSPNETIEEQIRIVFNGAGRRFKLIDGLRSDIDVAVKGTLLMGVYPNSVLYKCRISRWCLFHPNNQYASAV